jgi:hypothetical protein
MRIRAIIKSASPQMTKRKHHSSCCSGFSVFFKLSRNSVTHREESQTSAIDKTLQSIPSAEEEATVTTIGAMVLGEVIGLTTDFGGPLDKISYKQLCCQNEDQGCR